jgi:oligopeptide transport system ATP-binding protein
MSDHVVEVDALSVHFPVTRGLLFERSAGSVRAVDGVSFAIARGETLGLVGESGCGKTTVGRALVGLTKPTGGSIRFPGTPAAEAGTMRRQVQFIFQDPYASLNPRMTVAGTIAEPIELHRLREGRAAIDARVAELIALVGLSRHHAERYPHEFSGGQRQRIGIARALACEPDLIVCDEPVSALDVSIQAQVLKLLKRLQGEARADLPVHRPWPRRGEAQSRTRVAAMYLGRIVEIAPGRQSSTTRATPIPGRCSARCRCPTRCANARGGGSSCRATCRAPRIRPPAAGSRRAARWPRTAAAAAILRWRATGADHLSWCWRADELDALMPLADIRRPAAV